MNHYIDLSSIIDVEPDIDLVLNLINDENLVVKIVDWLKGDDSDKD